MILAEQFSVTNSQLTYLGFFSGVVAASFVYFLIWLIEGILEWREERKKPEKNPEPFIPELPKVVAVAQEVARNVQETERIESLRIDEGDERGDREGSEES